MSYFKKFFILSLFIVICVSEANRENNFISLIEITISNPQQYEQGI